jgi:protein-tyrosine kinase
MTKKEGPFVQQDNSSLEARDYSSHRKERDKGRGFIGQKTSLLKREVTHRMEATAITWWVRIKNIVKRLFFGPSNENYIQTANPVSKETPTPKLRHNESGWISPPYITSKHVKLDGSVVAENRCVGALARPCEIDSYKVLRTQISQLTKKDGKNTIMVTSARPGEGKTLTAINLALSFAMEFDQTALLVDCDLKKQSVHKILGIESKQGLVDYLLNGVDLSQLILWPGIEKFTFLSGGHTLFDSSELLGSPRMKELITEMKDRYPERYVVFDVPPVLTGADALAFAPLVDGILIVVEAGKTSINDVNEAISLLPKEKILGLVLNKSGLGGNV